MSKETYYLHFCGQLQRGPKLPTLNPKAPNPNPQPQLSKPCYLNPIYLNPENYLDYLNYLNPPIRTSVGSCSGVARAVLGVLPRRVCVRTRHACACVHVRACVCARARACVL
jgi:hypothetical protein